MKLRKQRRKYFSKILVTFLLLTTVLISALSISMYTIFRNLHLKTVNEMNMKVLSQMSYGKEYMDLAANNLGNMLLMNNYVYTAMTNKEFNTLLTTNALSVLRASVDSNNGIDSIYYYNAYQDSIVSSLTGEEVNAKDFLDKSAVDLIKKGQAEVIGKPIPRKIATLYGAQNKETRFRNVYTYIFPILPYMDENKASTIVINIEEEWLSQMILFLREKGKQEQSTILSFNQDGALINSNDQELFLENDKQQGYIQKIIVMNQESGTFIEKYNGEKYVFTFINNKNNGWIFVSLTPYEVVFRDLNTLVLWANVIFGLILFAGIWLSYYAAGKLYTPIHKVKKYLDDKLSKEAISSLKPANELDYFMDSFDHIYKTNTDLKSEAWRTNSQLKNRLLIEIFLGRQSISNQSTQFELDKYDLKLFSNEKSAYSIVLLEIDNYDQYLIDSSNNERNIYEFAIMNIAGELLAESYENEFVYMGEGEFGCILSIDHDTEGYVYNISKIAKKLQEAVEQFYHISLSVFIGEVLSDLNLLNPQYLQVKNLARYKFVKGNKCVLSMEHLESIDIEHYVVSSKQEKLFIDAIKLANLDKAIKIYGQISEEAIVHTYENFMSVYFGLAYLLYNECSFGYENEENGFAMIFMPFIGKLSKMRTVEEVNEAFTQLIAGVIEHFNVMNLKKNNDTVVLIQEIIQQDYQNKNLCLNVIAEQLNKSPVYLGRIFRENMNQSISDYILDYRMNKIKTLLDETDLPANEILEQAGIERSNYFYTLFKKHFGVTLTAYQRIKK